MLLNTNIQNTNFLLLVLVEQHHKKNSWNLISIFLMELLLL